MEAEETKVGDGARNGWRFFEPGRKIAEYYSEVLNSIIYSIKFTSEEYENSSGCVHPTGEARPLHNFLVEDGAE